MMVTFLKYALVGTTGTVIDVGLFALLMQTSLGTTAMGMIVAASMSFALAVLNNFVWNRRWTFRAQGGDVTRQFTKFFAVSCGGWLLNTLILVIIAMVFPPVLAKICASSVVLIYNFSANRFWTFSRST